MACSSTGKAFYFQSGAPNARVSRSEVVGCEDFFYIQGNLDGVIVENNYLHTLVGTSESHADGFQIGEAMLATGKLVIQGNYFDANNPSIGKTDIIFATNYSEVDLVFASNYIEPWGVFTFRCYNKTACTFRNNVFSQAFIGDEQNIFYTSSSKPALFACNRYANGELVEEFINGRDLVVGTSHVVDDCPPFVPPLPWRNLLLSE